MKFNKKINKFPIVLFIMSIIIRLLMIIIFNFPQISDFEVLLKASKLFVVGDYSFQYDSYFNLWAYQTGFVVYEGLLLKLFNSVFLLKFLNVIYSSSLCLIIYFVGKKYCSEKSARIASMLYMIFPFSLYLNTVLANHHLATLLSYLGILFILKKDKKKLDYIISAILISIGNIIRPEGIVIICTVILFELFKTNKKHIVNTIKNLLIFLLFYYLIGFTASSFIQHTNINKEGLKNNNLTWKFLLGSNYNSCGHYNDNDLKYLNNEKKELEIIKKRIISSPMKTIKLMSCKVNHFWLQSDVSLKNTTYNDKVFNFLGLKIKFVDLEKIVASFNSILYMMTFFMFVLGIIYNAKKISKENSMFFVILSIVTFFVYLFIEIQPRYAYFIHISIFILSTNGYELILKKLKIVRKCSND